MGDDVDEMDFWDDSSVEEEYYYQTFDASHPLWAICEQGDLEALAVYVDSHYGIPEFETFQAIDPVTLATIKGHADFVQELIEMGEYYHNDRIMTSAMNEACIRGKLRCVQVICSFSGYGGGALSVELARRVIQHGHHEVLAWLQTSRYWTSPLHYLCVISPARVCGLLRGGEYSPHTASVPVLKTPVSIAGEMRAAGEAGEGTAAALVLRAAETWSARNHHLFPYNSRQWARDLLTIGVLLSGRFTRSEHSFLDAWHSHVMPRCVERSCHMDY